MADSGAIRSRRYRDTHPGYREHEKKRQAEVRQQPGYLEHAAEYQRRYYHNPVKAEVVLRKLIRQQLRHHRKRLRELEQEG